MSLSVRFAGSLALGLLLAACGPADHASPTGAEAIDGPFIHGRAIYLERIRLPPGTQLRVQLIDNRLADTPMAVVADEVFEAEGPPYDFALAYDPARIEADADYGLHASLRLPDGELAFITDTRVPVTPGNAEVVEFRLVRVTSRAHDAEGRTGEGAGDAPAGFLAIGTDGGWTVEVGHGEVPRMWVMLDSGRRQLEVPQSLPFGQPGAAWQGWRGEADGAPVELRFRGGTCEVNAGDAEFDAEVELVVDGDVLQGCGRHIRG